MARRAVLLIAFLPVLMAGCAAHTSSRGPAGVQRFEPAAPVSSVVAAYPARGSVLLFDRRPGWLNATDFTNRSDWPSTTSYYTPGEVIVYNERLIDYQGPTFGAPDYTYRRADSYRSQIGFR